ncbi:histone H1-like [Tubulanus polymorphus]|uniref:histone H1-like n=1 Tax=Tubulanus polymorphus TaxID=672921 RepID=UPI003DA2D5A0
MSDAVAAAPASPAKKAVAKKTAKPKAPAAHPPFNVMVKAAITALGDKTGSSLVAIKKYIAGHYKVDIERQGTFIRKELKSGLEKGTYVRYMNKGQGASGRFRLSQGAKKEEKDAAKPKKVVKKPAAKKVTKPKAAKPTKAKKPAAKKTTAKKATKASPKKKAAAKPAKKTKTPTKKAAAKPAKKKTPAKKTAAKKTAAKK